MMNPLLHEPVTRLARAVRARDPIGELSARVDLLRAKAVVTRERADALDAEADALELRLTSTIGTS